MIVRELLALIGFEVDEESLIKAEGAFEAIATSAFKLDQAIQKIGHISVAGFQELEYAAKQSGIGVQELGQRMAYLGRSVTDAITVGGRPGRAFYQMGIGAVELKDMLAKGGLPQILGTIADKFNVMTDAALKDKIAIGLFSQGGAQMVPFLSQGSAGIMKWGTELRKAGIMTDDMVKGGIALYHTLILLEFTIKGLTYSVLGPFLDRFNQLILSTATWIQQNREIIAQRIGNVIEAIGKGFEFAWFMAKNFSGSMAILGSIIFATLFPLTAFFAALFIAAEDLYTYFALDDKKSVTYALILMFELLQKRLKDMSPTDIVSAIFTNGLKAAEEFFAFLESKTGLGKSDEFGRKMGLPSQILQFINTLPGIKQLVKSMGQDPEDPQAYLDLFGPHVQQLPGSPLGPGAVDRYRPPSMTRGSINWFNPLNPVTEPHLTPGGIDQGGFVVEQLNFYGDVTPEASTDFVTKWDNWWDNKMRQTSRR